MPCDFIKIKLKEPSVQSKKHNRIKYIKHRLIQLKTQAAIEHIQKRKR